MPKLPDEVKGVCPVCKQPGIVLDAHGRLSEHRAPGVLYPAPFCLGTNQLPSTLKKFVSSHQ